MNGDDWPDYVIPAAWWKERDVLRDTHAWATGRFVPPEIMLTHVLAELTLRTPTTVVLPPIIGGPVALNFGGAIVAETGVGKTAGGRGLLHSATGHRPTGTSWPLGSGEVLVECLVETDGEGEKVPHGRPVLIHADEGRTLEELIARSGSTLISTLCSAISGAELGQTNATKGLRRRVPALDYRIAVVLNLQPVYLKGVLADVDGGLPQRFLFVSGTGHHLRADLEEPAAPLALPDIEVAMFTARTGYRPVVAVPEAIRTTIVADHVDRLRRLDDGQAVAGGSHRNLLRLRVAALLALAEGRTTVTDDDWDLALVPVDASDMMIASGEAMHAAEATRHARRRRNGPSVTPSPPTPPSSSIASNASLSRWHAGCGPNRGHRRLSAGACRPPATPCLTRRSTTPSPPAGSSNAPSPDRVRTSAPSTSPVTSRDRRRSSGVSADAYTPLSATVPTCSPGAPSHGERRKPPPGVSADASPPTPVIRPTHLRHSAQGEP